MTGRERILMALNHQEPDRIPFDIGATNVTGIAVAAYKKLLGIVPISDEIVALQDIIQQLADPSDEFIDYFNVDARGLLPTYYANFPLPEYGEKWEMTHLRALDTLIYTDEWGLQYQFRPTDDYYSLKTPLLPELSISIDDIKNLTFPEPDADWRFDGIDKRLQRYKAQGKAVLLKTLNSGFLETASKIRGTENVLMDLVLQKDILEALIERIFEFKYAYWDKALSLYGEQVDIIVEADDYGTQESLLLSPEFFREFFKPRWKRLFTFIKKKSPNIKIFFHSCGAIYSLIPDFIEMGIDILNPIQLSARGMDIKAIKRNFGGDIVLWGGGVDTQKVLPYATYQELNDHIRRNIDILAPGGGWVFSPVHNIQADVPVENIMEMFSIFKTYQNYKR